MNNSEFNPELVGVSVSAVYLPEHSQPDEGHYSFAYTVIISNAADSNVQLLTRHWIITDADNDVQEVRGEGVVGELPVIPPGGSFRYTSGATLKTPVGCMEGSYAMVALDDEQEQTADFEVSIPMFSLHMPTALH